MLTEKKLKEWGDDNCRGCRRWEENIDSGGLKGLCTVLRDAKEDVAAVGYVRFAIVQFVLGFEMGARIGLELTWPAECGHFVKMEDA